MFQNTPSLGSGFPAFIPYMESPYVVASVTFLIHLLSEKSKLSRVAKSYTRPLAIGATAQPGASKKI